MNYRMMGKFIYRILVLEGLFMIPALLISVYYQDTKAVHGFLNSLFVIGLIIFLLFILCKDAPSGFYAKEGLTCVGICWIVMGLLGCLPFYFSHEIPDFIDAFFEIVSGFTTTGSSIVPEVEKLSMGILYWRSFSHWVGGMGVLVFLLAIASVDKRSSGYTMHLLRAESPGPDVGKLVPKMKQTAVILYKIYIALTLLDIFFLVIGKMPLFDAVCTAFGTAGTGGFGIKNDSIAGYSPYLQNVCTIFMLLFGVNFSCYYLLLLRQFKNVWKDEELRLYIGIVLGSIGLIIWNLRGYYETFEETVRHAAFQVATVVTTTGFATTDFDLWPSFSKGILLCLMLMGACAGSTGGGFKVGRLLFMLKNLRRNILRILHPRKVQALKNNNRLVQEKVVDNVNAYLAAYVMIVIVSFIIVSLDGFSITTNLSAVIACFNNIGPGFEQVGPTCNFASYGILSKLVLILDMLAGRLEIFPILILFSRDTWKR